MIQKKIPLTSTRKSTPFLVEPNQNVYFKVQPYRKFGKVTDSKNIKMIPDLELQWEVPTLEWSFSGQIMLKI